MSARGTLAILGAMMLSVLLLGGCSIMGSLQADDVALGLQNGFATMGSHVGIFLH